MSESQSSISAQPVEQTAAVTRHSLAVGIVGAGLVLGIAFDALLRDQGLGINWLIMTLLLVTVVHVLAWRERLTFAGEGYWLLAPLVLLATFVVWRDSETLAVLNVFAWLVVGALMATRALKGKLRDGGVLRYALDLVVTGISGLIGAFQVFFNGLDWKKLHMPQVRNGSAVVRGLVIALPIVLVFCGLFSAADAVFAQWVNRILNVDVDLSWFFEHAFVIGIIAWLAIGVLWLLFNFSYDYTTMFSRPAFLRLGMIEVGIVLGLLNLLFAAFVLIQIRYLFGGITQLNLDARLTYAEYARRGFFELVTVAVLLLPTLLLAHWLLNPQDKRNQQRFQMLAGGLLVLLIAVMASAVQRMRLYQQEYGLTELRFYTSVFMGWLAVVFGWFAFTVLRNQRQKFMFGVLVSGLVFILGLNLVNPDAIIVGTNAERDQYHDFDGRYASSLSADAVPTLIDELDLMLPDDQCRAAGQLLNEFGTSNEDWRSWNFSRQRARIAVADNREMLEDMACSFDR